MRKIIGGRQRRGVFNQRGQAIIEGTVMLVIMVFVVVGLIAGCVDIYANIVGAEKLRQAALSAARVYSQQQTLYNSMLVESEEPTARANAIAVADSILDKLGVPKGRDIQVERDVSKGALVAKVTISANVLVPFQGLTHLPGHVSVTAFDAIGFGKVRLGRICAPLYPDALSNPNATNPYTYAAPGVKSIAINFPIFEADVQTPLAPGILTKALPVEGFEFGTFPGMSDADMSPDKVVGAGISAFGQGFKAGGKSVSTNVSP
jgi:Flp pilus assembly protein TadG